MNYDTWKTGYFDDSVSTDRPSCLDCCETSQKLDQASDFADGISRMLYGVDTFDRASLDYMLENLCWLLKAPVQTGEIIVRSINTQESKIFDFSLNIAKQLNASSQEKTI